MKKPAKEEVQRIMERSANAISHNELLKALGKQYNRVTIYRSLDKLVEEGVIHRIVDLDGVSKFAMCQNCEGAHEHNHIHFSCVKCQSVSCLEKVVPSFKMPKNYQVQEVNFTVSGICPNCQGN